MKKNNDPEYISNLSLKAEEALKKKLFNQPGSQLLNQHEADSLKLIHELEVHKIELELQNKELILAKEQAEISARKYAELYDFAPTGYFTLSKEGKIIELNNTGATMLGKNCEHLIDCRFDFFVSDDTKSEFNIFLRKTFSSNAKETCEAIISSAGNLPIHISISGIVAQKSDKCMVAVVDITGHSIEKEKLLIEKKLLSAIIENIPDQIYYKDTESRFIICNHAVALTCGSNTTQEMIGKTDFNFFPHDQAKQYFDDEQAIIKSGISLINHEEICTNKITDDVRWNLTAKLPLKDSKGVVIGLIGINRDITERKLEEEEIKHKNKELVTINAEKDKFFSIIAHDLRSPFNAFLGFTRMLVEELNTMTLEEIKTIVVSMRKSATNLYSLIENLLEWSMMQRGLIQVNPVSLLLANKIRESIKLIIASAQKKEIELIYDIPDDLSVFADEHMVETVIRNLIANAVKFTHKRGRITVTAKKSEENSVEICVKDTGIGMIPAIRDNLFRLDIQTNRKGTEGESSNGLGLLICKDFIEKHGGKIWVKSEEGKGCAFYFTLPQNPAIHQPGNL
ncbi:MAG: PAS domain-containing sensor histidine kinase [Bacteroidetes bacterium]|nr:PAS domain-containing sensor histidine kinase [Bacteroidota bacterium]